MKRKSKKLTNRPLPERLRKAVELYLSPPWSGMAAALRATGFSNANGTTPRKSDFQ